jgi:hypothetical protein
MAVRGDPFYKTGLRLAGLLFEGLPDRARYVPSQGFEEHP